MLLPGAAAFGGGTRVPAAEIQEAVRTFLLQQRTGSPEQEEITFRSVPENIEVPGPAYHLHVNGDDRTEWKGSLALRVEIELNGRVMHRCLVSVLIRTYADVLVAGRPIKRHSSPLPDDVRGLRMETTLMQRRTLTSMGVLEGLQARQIIPRGNILYEDLFERVPLVRQGDHVQVKVQSGGVCLLTEGIAREDGGRGEFVLVEFATRRERVRARIDGVQSVSVPVGAGKENQ